MFFHQILKGAIQGLQLLFMEHDGLVNQQDMGMSKPLSQTVLSGEVHGGLLSWVKGCLKSGVVCFFQVGGVGSNTWIKGEGMVWFIS